MKSSFTRRSFLRRAAAMSAAVLTSSRQSPGGEAPSDDSDFQPRFAICNETFQDWPFEKACEVSAKCGYRGIEIAPFTMAGSVTDVSAEKRRELRKQAEKQGLEVAGLHWLLARTKGLYLTSPEPDVRKRTAEYLGELARFCGDLGGKLLIFGSPKQRDLLPGVTHEKALEYAEEVFVRTLPVLEKTDVKLAIEPLAPKTTTFLRTAEEARELVKLVDSPRFQLILDCYAMSTETRPIPEILRANRSRLVHFHANDPNGQGPGFGKLDFVPILEALRDIRYHGWISVEVFDYSPGAETLARKSIDSLRKALGRLPAAGPEGT